MVSVNNNLKSLYIDGKPVKKASLGGKVFYEKREYGLTVVASPTHIPVGGTSTINAYLIDQHGGVEGKTVTFTGELSSVVVDSSGTYDFGNNFEIDVSDMFSNGGGIYIGNLSNKNISIMYNGTYLILSIFENVTLITNVILAGNFISIQDNVLTCQPTSGSSTYDITGIDLTQWTVTSNASVTVTKPFNKTAVTDSNGKASVNYTEKSKGLRKITCEVESLSADVMVQVGEYLTLTGDKNIIQRNDILDLIATLTDGGDTALSDTPVYFYEEYTPSSIDLTGDKSIIQTGDVLDLTAKLKDTDGSLVENAPVYFYEESPLNLTVDKTVLSYNDEDTCILTATLIGDDVAGKSIVFKADGTVLDTVLTDSSGVAECIYDSQGVGDVSFTAEYGSLVSETYSIRDVYFYDSMTSDSGHWTYDSAITKSFSSDGVSITASSDKKPVCDVTLPTNFRITFKAKSNANNDLRYCEIGDWIISNGSRSGVPMFMLFDGWPPQYYVNNTYVQPNIVEFEAEYLNGTLTLKKDRVTLITQTVTLNSQLFYLFTGAGHTMTIKDVIIEEL